jgi:hypothetical protein
VGTTVADAACSLTTTFISNNFSMMDDLPLDTSHPMVRDYLKLIR